MDLAIYRLQTTNQAPIPHAIISLYNSIAYCEAYLSGGWRVSKEALTLFSYLKQELAIRRMMLHKDYVGDASLFRTHINMLHGFQNEIYNKYELVDCSVHPRYRKLHAVLRKGFGSGANNFNFSTPATDRSISPASDTSSIADELFDGVEEAAAVIISLNTTQPEKHPRIRAIAPETQRLCNRMYESSCACKANEGERTMEIECRLMRLIDKTEERDFFIAQNRWNQLKPTRIPCVWGCKIGKARVQFPQLTSRDIYQEASHLISQTNDDAQDRLTYLEECSNWAREHMNLPYLENCRCPGRVF